jgi:hypothetical protein
LSWTSYGIVWRRNRLRLTLAPASHHIESAPVSTAAGGCSPVMQL